MPLVPGTLASVAFALCKWVRRLKIDLALPYPRGRRSPRNPPVTLHQFFDELKRRHVYRVAGVYLVVAWGAIEAVTGVSELLTDSDTPGKIVAWLAIAGFPVALLLSWFFDLTRQGIVRTPEAAAVQPGTRPLPILSSRATGMFGLGMVVALLSFAGYSIIRERGPSGSATSVRALAVLPLESSAESPLPDAIAEELIRRLSREDSLEVTARTSAFRFKGSDESLPEIGRQLGVQALLAGSVRQQGEEYVIGVELIDVTSGRVLWSPPSYRVSEREAYSVHERIAADLLGALEVGGAARMPTRATTKNEQAAKLYTLGLERLRSRTDRDLRAALTYFQRATEQDREYAAAFAAMAQTYAVLPTAGDFDPVEAFTKGMTAASMAISLDPTSSEAHAAVGQLVQNYDWEPSASLRSYERAIEFNRSNAVAHQWYAEALLLLGRYDEAEAEIAEAVKLDPLSPSAMHTQAYVQLVKGDVEGAFATLVAGLSLFPEFRLGHMTLALTAALTERYPEMQRALEAFADGDAATRTLLAQLAEGVRNPASRARGRQALASLEPVIGSSVTALWLAALQDRDGAMAALQRAYEKRADPNFLYIVVHPLLAPLHELPAYRAILEDVGVQPPTA